MPIRLTHTEAEIAACFAVMQELRPHLSPDEFVERVQRQQQQGFLLAALEEEGEVMAVAGFRLLESLAWGRFLYVDDLVTQSEVRSKGHGRLLLDWLVRYAREHRCQELHLDSGVQRFRAHRFYLLHGMEISCHHFAMRL